MFWIACKIFLALTLLTGCIYPLIVTSLAQLLMPHKANGKTIIIDGQVRGYELIGQSFKEDKYFWVRPSQSNYNPLHSGASNLSPTSKKLQQLVQERAQHLMQTHRSSKSSLPTNLLYASSSGLDPHISPEAAYFQIKRIARARHLTTDQEQEILIAIYHMREGRQLGLLGPRYVNVLKLNQLLDQKFSNSRGHDGR